MYVKCFDTVMFYYVIFFNIFEFPAGSVPRTSRRSQGTEPGRRMPASAGGHGWGRCRGD
ncbi:unnamed protein product, partial [Staurois parvus]